QVGLHILLQKNCPEKTINVTGFEEPNLAWMAGIDVVADQDYQGALVIVKYNANTARVDDDLYTQGYFLIKIDHHPN
ncbi:bifunctional oligoribonuclease/PAP phosphatase NrnA, partial [Streptococcus suis]